MSEELQASGIDAEVSEFDAIIEDLIGKEDAAVDSGKNGKKKAEVDKKAAEEIWTKAMERFGQSSKRNGDEGEGSRQKEKKEKWQRSSRVPQRESKDEPCSEGGGATAKERSTKPKNVVTTAAATNESSIPFPCQQNVIERKETNWLF